MLKVSIVDLSVLTLTETITSIRISAILRVVQNKLHKNENGT